MTIDVLRKIVEESNEKYLRPFHQAGREYDGGCVIVESSEKGNLPALNGCFANNAQNGCFEGFLRNQRADGKDLEAYLILQDDTRRGKVAVGTVIDRPTGEIGDADVVVAAGINYSQGDNYLRWAISNPFKSGPFDKTNMRLKLDSVLARLTGTNTAENSPIPVYHLVAANFFPWITRLTWREQVRSSIEETLLLRCYGVADPYEHIVDLVTRIQDAAGGKTKVSIVYHGAHSAAAHMGGEMTSRLSRHLVAKLDAIIFADNLAYRSQ
jgi:hypothetical protein